MTKKRVLLTGGGGGIGKAILEALHNNYDVVAPDRGTIDLSDAVSITEYFKNESRFDILINNAGINIIKEISDITDQDIDSVLGINLVAPIKLIKEVVPHMKKQRYGKILNISSIWGIRSKEKRTLYSASKFALIGSTKALSRELGKYNILVNALCPGFTATELTMRSLSVSEQDGLLEQIPIGRMAQPSEIANYVKFLISEENSYMTGQTLVVDGGFLA